MRKEKRKNELKQVCYAYEHDFDAACTLVVCYSLLMQPVVMLLRYVIKIENASTRFVYVYFFTL